MPLATEGQFNPSFHFLGLIQKALSDGIPRRCSMPACPEVYIVPTDKAYYTTAPNVQALRELCLAAPFDLMVEPVPDWRPDGGKEAVQAGRLWMRKPKAETAAPSLPARPLQELLWYASLSASHGQLLHGCRADDLVRLKRCPDFSILPHSEHDMTLAVFMMEESGDLLTVAEATGIPLAKVFDFHNACAALGLIERGNAFDPGEYLAGAIQRALVDRQMRRCELPGRAPLFLAPAEGKYYTQGDAATVAAYATASLAEMDIGIADGLGTQAGEEEELVQIGRMWVRRKKEVQVAAPPAYPLTQLLFRATLDTSRGRLVAGSSLGDTVRLTRWPEAHCLELDRRFFALAAFMSANTASVAKISEYTGISLGRVAEFHNACAALGLIETGGTESIKAKPVAEGQREIYRKISKALETMKAGAQHEPTS
ncbi:hypothetical protein SAMN02949497_2697 [Methylomagnum ishizawai]|uniref:Uncharacterized protein n=1 Tax=Methylomagnum ishizawai TaxID=1760988 RepID=A0A1Y6CYG1_9GAMM|nr:hypothetical protein [Methylomagnum ishizawai]SMF95336.1 hypothetical protein SAMN02949497_2697 [Methylomagnum ishizawai]